ncbi:hypothetical protein DFH09DRAFT_1371670 [Mycena vulgaris]|nr:hypothetical protein DFH09DRAFT_1371670 [Mycena vulgaris]
MSVPGPGPALNPAIDPAFGPAPAPQTVSTAPSLPSPTKRKYDEMHAALAGLHQPVPVKRRKRGKNANLSTMDRLTTSAKYFTRAVSPYMDIGAAMSYGPEYHWITRAAPDPSNTIVTPASEVQREQAYVKAFDKLFSVMPDLLDVVKRLYLDAKNKPDKWNALVKEMQKAATSARTSDTGAGPSCPQARVQVGSWLRHPVLRSLLLSWPDRLRLPPLGLLSSNAPAPEPPAAGGEEVPERRGDDAPDPPPAEGEDVPAVESNNDFLARVAAGRVELTADQLPSFLYEDGSYDSVDLDKGLLRGHLTLRTLRHIWTAPASALFGLDGAVPNICNARFHDVFKVDAEMVAYAVVQARTMLTTADWKPRDGSFDYEVFFNSIVELFADGEDPWTKDTLAWYQR